MQKLINLSTAQKQNHLDEYVEPEKIVKAAMNKVVDFLVENKKLELDIDSIKNLKEEPLNYKKSNTLYQLMTQHPSVVKVHSTDLQMKENSIDNKIYISSKVFKIVHQMIQSKKPSEWKDREIASKEVKIWSIRKCSGFSGNAYGFFSEAISMEKRYLTSDLSILS